MVTGEITVAQPVPLFEKSQCPPGTPEDLLHAINGVIDRFRVSLVDQIVLPEPPMDFRVPNMVRGYIQAHLRRLLMFLDGGHAEYLAGRPLMTEMASRAIYENVATLCDFSAKLKPLCDAADYWGVEALVTKAAFVTRIPSILEAHGEDVKPEPAPSCCFPNINRDCRCFRDRNGSGGQEDDVRHVGHADG